MSLTTAQAEAVRARGNLIVVAGAGTGKTSTLVERVVALLEEGASLDRLLLVTFTDAAAGEMRHRLRLRLTGLASTTDPAAAVRWAEQLALLDTAPIGTLHSFCLRLVRDHFHLLGIDPGAGILDDTQTRPLIEAALDACLAAPLEKSDPAAPAAQTAIRHYAGGDPERIRPLLLKLHRHAQTLPDPDRWFAEQQATLMETEPARWREWLARGLTEWAQEWLVELRPKASLAANFSRSVAALEQVVTLATAAPDSATLREALLEILAADNSEWPKGRKTILRQPVTKLFEEATFFASQFETTDAGDGLAADRLAVRDSLLALLQLARDFGRHFAAAKRDVGGMDFSDLEQFALRLLWTPDSQPTAVAEACRARLDHVFVDECQDINAAQDAILRAVSRPGPAGNRFLVGDVKQSIYQFRLARPALFLNYEREWQDGAHGKRISLTENFRSHREVIAFVNAFFSPLMRPAVGGVAYESLAAARAEAGAEKAEATEPMAATPPEAGHQPAHRSDAPAPTRPATAPEPPRRVEFLLIPKRDANAPENGEEEETEASPAGEEVADLLAAEREARVVALRLRALKESGATIWDKAANRTRPVAWRDMAVLLRSPRGRAEVFAREFHRCGVPLAAERGGFLASLEVSDLLSLVRILDNPLQDIPLLAVLRSPLVGMTLDELAQIRLASDARRWWIALKEFLLRDGKSTAASPTPELTARARRKVDWFLQHHARWRELARHSSLTHCLETALAETHYEAITRAGERGEERLANVRKLLLLARQHDPFQRQGIFRFLRFIETLEAAKEDIEPAPVAAADAVRLMSIHKSKGLEFPVVAVAALGTRFNLSDLRADVLVDEQFGLSARAVANSGAKHPTLPHWLAARRQRRQVLGEELRLLYVAMTRARDHLILTGTAPRKDADPWAAAPEREFSDHSLLKAQSMLDWVLLWLPSALRPEESAGDEGTTEFFHWAICREEPALPSAPSPSAAETVKPDAPADFSAMRERLTWRYPQATATNEPAKTNVTALRRRATEADEDARPWRFTTAATEDSRDLDAAAVGTLHHEFLRVLSLSGPGDEADLRGQLDRLVAAGGFTPNEAKALDLPALAEFWQGETGSLIRAHADAVRRELPFTARFTPAELARLTGQPAPPGLMEEFIVVQGVADLAVLLPVEIWLLDFKTDHVRGTELEARVGEYRPQLELYAAALAGIFRRPVTRRWLHFLRARRTVSV
jgi:ATP-dependent helicase/nuclease subunit A